MHLATYFPVLRRQMSYSLSDSLGSIVAHQDLCEAALRSGSVDSLRAFSGGAWEIGVPAAEQDALTRRALAELSERLGPAAVRSHRLEDMRDIACTSGAVFLTKAPGNVALAHLRSSLASVPFPICGIVHSVVWPKLPSQHLALANSLEPYDSLVVTSRAAERAVRAISQQVAELQPVGSRAARPLNLVRIPLGVDSQLLDGQPGESLRRHLNLPEDAVVLLYLGRLTDEYKADLEPLLQAYRVIDGRHPGKTALVLAGSQSLNNYSQKLEALCRQFGISDRTRIVENFAPYLKRGLLQTADIFVSPVDNIQESYGIAILEAMASGLPVVASDWSGYRDLVVEGKTGLLVPTYMDTAVGADCAWRMECLGPPSAEAVAARRTIVDVRELIAHLDTLVTNPALRRRMGEEGRRRVKSEYCWPVVIRRFVDLWEAQLAAASAECVNRRVAIDFGAAFGHYATQTIEPWLLVGPGDVDCSPGSAEWLRLERELPPPVAAESRRVLALLAESSQTVGQLNADPMILSLLLKRGYCGFCRPAAADPVIVEPEEQLLQC